MSPQNQTSQLETLHPESVDRLLAFVREPQIVGIPPKFESFDDWAVVSDAVHQLVDQNVDA